MMKRLSIMMYFAAVLIVGATAVQTNAQTGKSIGAAETNGTFRDYFSGKFKGNYNEIKIRALGKGKLKISFALTYPHLDAQGEMTANTGEAEGKASIVGDTATYSSSEFGACKITILFVKSGTIKVGQQGTDAECGFGFNVNAEGIYKKVSGAKPKF